MSLITRCPACGTMFKVVTDQLKVSQGWVRCGQCTEVFNASVYLQPHPAVAAASQLPFPPPSQPSLQAPAIQADIPAQPVFAPQPPISTPGAVGQPESSRHTELIDTPAALSAEADQPGHGFLDDHTNALDTSGVSSSGLEWNTSSPEHKQSLQTSEPDPALGLPSEDVLQSSGSLATPDSPLLQNFERTKNADRKDAERKDALFLADDGQDGRDSSVSPYAPESIDSTDESASTDVSFVRDARRKAFWRKPAVRLVLGSFVLLCAAALLLQFALHSKDSLLAHEPRLRPLLLAMCQKFQCELAPLRQIDAMVIDSSSFNKLDSNSYRLSFTLKNSATSAVALPALEVTLTDTQDQPMIRRVLTPSQFGASDKAALGAGQEFSGVVVLQVSATAGKAADTSAADSASAGSGTRVAGYRLLAFYP